MENVLLEQPSAFRAGLGFLGGSDVAFPGFGVPKDVSDPFGIRERYGLSLNVPYFASFGSKPLKIPTQGRLWQGVGWEGNKILLQEQIKERENKENS